MVIIIDLDLQQAVQSFGSKQAAPPITVKNQDTPTLSIYFAKGNVNYDLGTSPGIRFGVFGSGPNALVAYSSFSRILDAQSRVTYVGYPNFNTVQMAAAIGAQASITCVGEIRYQTSFGTIARTLDIAFTVERSLLSETILDTTIAAFTTPAVNANVTVRINNTGWLSTGLNLAIGAGAGAYQVVSITNATDFVAQNTGGAGNAAPATVIPSGTNVGIAATNVIQTYPDASLLELLTRKGVASGYAGLNSSAKLIAAAIPVDGTTINLSSAGNLQFASIAASVAANFVTPASGGTVNVTVSSSSAFVVGQWVRIPIAGYYSVTVVPDGTHVTIQNLGDPWNAGSGTTITSGAAILPWTSLGGTGGGGSPGQNAFSTTSANFTVPAALTTVAVSLASTAWLGGAGYVVFIAGAGYYSVSSITDATHAVLTNLAYPLTNAAPGTVISSGAMVTPGGIAGPSSTGTPGANAYDATSASFTMPAVAASANVTIGNTAWLSTGQVIYITSAGYFQVASILSPTVFSATALNYPGNATVGATIASGVHVSPGGLIGPAGAGGAGLNAFTTLSASFTQPAASATVSINVGTTAWMVVGQAVFILGGGYYTVASVTDINHAVVTNLGYSGNAAPGATVASGGGVVPSGLNGQAGTSAFTTTTANFTMPTSGSTVTVTVASTAWMAQGQNLFIPTAGYLSVSVVTDSTHAVLTNSGTIGNAAAGTVISSGAQVSPAGSPGPIGATGPTGPTGGGGGGGTATLFDPRNGIFIYDDFLWNPAYQGGTTLPQEWEGQGGGGGGAITFSSTYGLDATRRSQGIIELSTGVAAANNSGYSVARGKNSGTANGSILLGYGTCDIAFRLALEEASLPPTGIGYVLRAGLWLQGTAGHPTGVANWYEALFLEYSPDNNSGILRIGYFNNGYGNPGTTISYVNCTAGTPTPNGYGWWELKVDTAGNVTAWLNGTQIGSATGVAPLSQPMVPIVFFYRNSASTTNFHIALDAVYINYPYTR